jgi:hypothetical protein
MNLASYPLTFMTAINKITSAEGLRVALEQLNRVYTGLAALRDEHPNVRPEWHAVMAEGFLDHAQQLREEIEAYGGARASAAPAQ